MIKKNDALNSEIHHLENKLNNTQEVMESEFNEQLKLKNEIINEFDEYKIKNAAKEAE